MHPVDLRTTFNDGFEAPEASKNSSNAWHSSPFSTWHDAVKKIAQGIAVCVMNTNFQHKMHDLHLFIEMTNTSLKPRTKVENTSGALVHTDVAEINLTSVEGSKYTVNSLMKYQDMCLFVT